MALYWRQDRAGPLRPLPRHPSAHWWYTLDDELRAAGEEGLNTRLLALDLEAPDAVAGLPPLLLTTDQGQALHKGLPLPDQEEEEEEGPLDTLMARMRDGLRDRTLIAPVLPGAADCTLATGPGTGAAEVPLVPKDSTVIGVIDDGIAFAHPAFRMDAGQRSRFASLWQQDAQCLRAGSADVPFGHVFSRAEIEQRLQEAGYDEDRFYRNLPPHWQKGERAVSLSSPAWHPCRGSGGGRGARRRDGHRTREIPDCGGELAHSDGQRYGSHLYGRGHDPWRSRYYAPHRSHDACGGCRLPAHYQPQLWSGWGGQERWPSGGLRVGAGHGVLASQA